MKRVYIAILVMIPFLFCRLSCWKPDTIGQKWDYPAGRIPDHLQSRAWYFGYKNYSGGYIGDYYSFRFEHCYNYDIRPDSVDLKKRINKEARRFYDSVLFDQKTNYDLLTNTPLKFDVSYHDSLNSDINGGYTFTYDLRNYPFVK